jgi:chlorobactene glucosyltransferase
MNVGRLTARICALRGLRALVSSRSLLTGSLFVMALVALYQSYRTRRAGKETQPPIESPLPEPAPHVSIILPVRDEEVNLEACVSMLLAQEYPDFDITIIDDGSTDATPQLIAELSKRDRRIRSLRIDQLPPGWAGKPHALHAGVMHTNGEWLLFTDADTRHAPQTLRRMVEHATSQHADLLSMCTNLMTMSGTAMPLLMPLSEIILAHRVTPGEIKDPNYPRAFAFGQYILVRREAYIASGGYAASYMRTTFIDDLALAEQFKSCRKRVELVDGRGLVMNRQWTTWKSARQGWGKSCYSEIIRLRIPLAGAPGALALIVYGLGPLLTLVSALFTRKAQKGRRIPTLLAAVTLLAQIDAKRHADRQHRLPFAWSLAAPLSWAVFGVMVLDVAWQILTGRGAQWKGRQIHIPSHVEQKAVPVDVPSTLAEAL